MICGVNFSSAATAWPPRTVKPTAATQYAPVLRIMVARPFNRWSGSLSYSADAEVGRPATNDFSCGLSSRCAPALAILPRARRARLDVARFALGPRDHDARFPAGPRARAPALAPTIR